MPLNGQWSGRLEISYPNGMFGPGQGRITADIDERGEYFEGVAHLYYEEPAFVPGTQTQIPPMDILFRTEGKDSCTRFHSVYVGVLDQVSGMSIRWSEIKDRPENIKVADKIEGVAEVKASSLDITWETDIGTKGHAVLSQSKSQDPSELKAKVCNWAEFKSVVSGIDGRSKVFRGQKQHSWRLRTSYHRLGRANLSRYLTEDMRALHLALSARTKHYFDLADAEQNGAFLNLAQHHGYPTPLLDWTYSPYVAAFFAFRGMTREDAHAPNHPRVRIFVFDQARWRRDMAQITRLIVGFQHVSMLEPLALENDRLIPQQSLTMLTNVDDIESYIASMDKKGGGYLSAIDIPWSERDLVIADLHRMGITAGSMFPGLDGTCEELKERNFLMF
jgi:hypothetical protein